MFSSELRNGDRICLLTVNRRQVTDITLQNSPDWTFHILNSTNVVVRGVTQYGDSRWPNNDGIDIDSRQVRRHVVGIDGACCRVAADLTHSFAACRVCLCCVAAVCGCVAAVCGCVVAVCDSV